MNSEFAVSDDLKDCLAQLRSVIAGLLRIIDALIAVVVKDDSVSALRQETTCIPDQTTSVLPLMLQALGSSSYTILRLSDAPGLQTRDCYSIARSVVEVAVNICYIIGEGVDAAERAQRHAEQKSFRDMERVSKIGNTLWKVSYNGHPDSATMERLNNYIAEFTSRTGREKSWLDQNIDDRIATVGRHFGESVLINLHSAKFMIYRHASEILHGTFFGAVYFLGTEPSGRKRTPKEFVESLGWHHIMLLFSIVCSLLAVIESFDRAYGFKVAQDRARALSKSLQNISFLSTNPGGSTPEQDQK